MPAEGDRCRDDRLDDSYVERDEAVHLWIRHRLQHWKQSAVDQRVRPSGVQAGGVSRKTRGRKRGSLPCSSPRRLCWCASGSATPRQRFLPSEEPSSSSVCGRCERLGQALERAGDCGNSSRLPGCNVAGDSQSAPENRVVANSDESSGGDKLRIIGDPKHEETTVGVGQGAARSTKSSLAAASLESGRASLRSKSSVSNRPFVRISRIASTLQSPSARGVIAPLAAPELFAEAPRQRASLSARLHDAHRPSTQSATFRSANHRATFSTASMISAGGLLLGNRRPEPEPRRSPGVGLKFAKPPTT